MTVCESCFKGQHKDCIGPARCTCFRGNSLHCPETSVHEYACGCLVPTGEAGRYYDHACASCHRANWTRKVAL